MSGRRKTTVQKISEPSGHLQDSEEGPADQLAAMSTREMASEALRLAKSMAETVQQIRADIIKNNEELKTFMHAVMGTLQTGVATAAAAPAAPTPAPTVPLSPSPTIPLSSDLSASSAPEQTVPLVPDDATGADSQPSMPLRNVRAKRRHLGANYSCQAAANLRESSCLSAGATESEETENQSSTFEDALEGGDASGADNANADQRRHRCEECGNTFTTKSSLKVHMRYIHTQERPYACDECDMAFKIKRDLTRHISIHTGERPFECEECGDTFKQKGNLTRHMSMHTGEKPYQCDECGDAFKLKQHLATHMSTHTGEKPFECGECDMKFARKSSLTRHIRKHTGEKPYKCSICGKAFSQKSDLNVHMRTQHTREKP